MTLTSSPSKRTLSARGKGFMFILAAVSALVVALVVFLLLSRVSAQTEYYVLNKDVSARTQITAADLTPVTVSVGGAPRSYSLEDVQRDPLYAKYALHAGDILSDSNVSNQLTDLRAGLPNNYVVSSFVAQPSDAVSGKVVAGDYVNLYAVTEGTDNNPISHLFLQHVLVLDAQQNLNGSASASDAGDAGTTSTSGGGTSTSGSSGGTTSSTGASAAEAGSTRAGIPSLFTVGVSPQNAARLALSSQYTIYVTLASKSQAAATTTLPGANVGASGDDLLSGDAPDAGAGTIADPTQNSEANGRAGAATDTGTGTASNAPSTGATPAPSSSTPAPTGSATTSADQ